LLTSNPQVAGSIPAGRAFAGCRHGSPAFLIF